MKFQEDFQKFVNFVCLKDTVESNILKGLRVKSVESLSGETRMKLEIEVLPSFLNGYGGVFGGAMAAIMDLASNVLALSLDSRVTYSMELNVTYVGVARVGETLAVDVFCPKAGKNIFFSSVEVRSKGKVIALATNTRTFAPSLKWRNLISNPKI